MKLMDLHNHSTYSRDGNDTIEDLVANAIKNNLNTFGMTDHNYWLNEDIDKYIEHINRLKNEYKDKLNILCGVELAIMNPHANLIPELYDNCDYYIFEHIGHPNGISFKDFLNYRKKYKKRAGIAHTDIFEISKNEGIDVPRLMAENDIFWEINVNYDRVHGYNTHQYWLNLKNDNLLQEKVLNSGVELSVGFDTHLLLDYDINRIIAAHEFIEKQGFKLVDIKG